MNELVKIDNMLIGGEKINAVNARDLHKALDSKKDYSTWIKSRIERLQLVQDRDFVLLPQMGEQVPQGNGGGLNRKDYAVSVEIAKHIAMIEMTDKGREVREYFIECEKQLQQTFKAPTNMIEALELALEQQKALVALEAENKEQAKVIEYQGDKLDAYKTMEVARRSKQQMRMEFNKKARLLGVQKFEGDINQAYNAIYSEFAKSHCIKDKINISYIAKNNDYLAECLSIALSMLD